MELNKLYFYTATIIGWKHLLKPDKYKDVIIDSLKYLIKIKKIVVYGFVIMPNHIHLIWELLELNGKEYPHASFMKHTSHEMLKDLRVYNKDVLELFKVNLSTRNHQFWQRDSLPVHLYTPEVIYQKLDYIHGNPVQKNWSLAQEPCEYNYSSASFYEKDKDDFDILTHVGTRI
ncbi:transposase [Cytophagaceae bacterium AH-315-L13]|nr:transposase [Cytophagaceae bacterium AH-315-L13]